MSNHLRAAAFALATCLPALLAAQALEVRNNGHVVVRHSSALVPTNLTVEAWIELDANATDTYATIVRKNVNTAEAYVLRLSRLQTSIPYVEFNLTTSAGTNIIRAFGGPIQPATPTHVAATYDGNRVRIYVNGSQVREALVTGAIQDTGNALWIGEGDMNNPNGESFQGRIDAVRIWNTARTAAEIDETIDVELTSAPGLVAAWNFDQDLADATGNGNGATGYFGFNPLFADEFTNFAGALDLDAPGDLLTVAHDPALAPSTVFVEAWCVLDSSVTATVPTILRKNVTTTAAYALQLSSYLTGGAYFPEFTFTVPNGAFALRSVRTAIPLDTPVHVAGSFDGRRARVYMNGEVVGELYVNGSLSDTGGPLQIGLGDPLQPQGEQFVGQIDAIRIWDRVPTSCEIRGGLNRELDDRRGLIAAWNFDGGLGDATGNGHDAVGTGHDYAVEFSNYAQALKISTNSANSWIEVANPPELGPDQFTIEGVAQLDRTHSNQYGTIASKGGLGTDSYLLRVGWSTQLNSLFAEFLFATSPSGTVALQAPIAGSPYAPHHLAATFTGSSAHLYIDGQQVASNAANGLLVDSPGILRIGQGSTNGGLSQQFEGRIDSVRLWNHARTAADIASTMHREIDSMPGLIAAWNFNGDLTDATGHGFDGTAVGSVDLVDEFANLVGSYCSPIAYGHPSSNCAVKPRVFASNLCEEDGITSFGCLDAPANGIGLFLFTSATRPTPSFVDGLDVWVDTSALVSFGVGAAADAFGRSKVSFPVSNGYSAVLPAAIQYFWFDTSCGRTALNLTTSDALQIGPF